MITILKIEAPPAGRAGGTISYLDNNRVNATSRLTETEIQHALYTPPSS